MIGCTPCEESLSSNSPLTIHLSKSVDRINVYARNNGRNIIVIKRLLFCKTRPNGGRIIEYLREENFIISGTVEPEMTRIMYSGFIGDALSARAYAEYFEIPGRSQSCEIELRQVVIGGVS